MKKLLLFIVPLLLLFGVSFGDLIVLSGGQAGIQSTNDNRGQVFTINTDFLLYSVQSPSGSTCNQCALYVFNTVDNGTTTLIKTGTFSSNSCVLNTLLTGNMRYSVEIGNTNNSSCKKVWGTTNVSSLYARDFMTIGPYGTINGAVQSSTYYNGPISYTFSGVYPASTPITIWYNGTGMTFAGSNIYLTDLFHNYTMSGTDIVFTPYVYRALFRSH